ncbi:hypothetical protein CEXT_709321 [Caerostris extrusa]|uniref:Uncharacterized protein n=1 Tax=Caerostris extrusa TaxID=172846 RepID=A0AAV4MTC9_CAEEX|nr:hypothetical protein CEXT_709321 [Caerostris extrusa]
MVISVDAFTVVALSLTSHRLLEEKGDDSIQTRFLRHVQTLTPPLFSSSSENGGRKRFFIMKEKIYQWGHGASLKERKEGNGVDPGFVAPESPPRSLAIPPEALASIPVWTDLSIPLADGQMSAF